ncbi:hypothetical protein [Streptomyces tsukubensis]|uniref:hypothetical protein n=1 Tax=Streptomyces tsukubensis TaxID=83656 RepID=UPI00386743FD
MPRCHLASLKCSSTRRPPTAPGRGVARQPRLLRQYLPKGADLRPFSQADLDTFAHELNHRSRKAHGYRPRPRSTLTC